MVSNGIRLILSFMKISQLFQKQKEGEHIYTHKQTEKHAENTAIS